MANKNQQKPTERLNINVETGLTPLQEQAAFMIATGETITDVAKKMQLNRSTLYEWYKLITFQCFVNKISDDYRQHLRSGLYALSNDVLQTLKDCLQSSNDGVKLRAAMWLFDKVKDHPVINTDARDVIKRKCTHQFIFDEEEYEEELRRYNLWED